MRVEIELAVHRESDAFFGDHNGYRIKICSDSLREELFMFPKKVKTLWLILEKKDSPTAYRVTRSFIRRANSDVFSFLVIDRELHLVYRELERAIHNYMPCYARIEY